jgi:dTDP-4-dehydrorhamnose 3,5-epimerase
MLIDNFVYITRKRRIPVKNQDKVIQKSEIDGLHFEENLFSGSKEQGFINAIASSGPGITDLVTHSPDFFYLHYGIHIAQVDRLTFFGPLNKKITGYFVDCRKNSETLHKQVILEFYPDPTKKLYIDRGIAHTFDGLDNVLTRDEPLWYMTTGNLDYNMANDVVNVSRNTKLSEFPVVEINKYPIPRKAYEFILDIQHITLGELQHYPNRLKLKIDGETRYVNLKPKTEKKGG